MHYLMVSGTNEVQKEKAYNSETGQFSFAAYRDDRTSDTVLVSETFE